MARYFIPCASRALGALEAKTSTTTDRAPLFDVVRALEAPGALVDNLATIIDVDQFARFWATEVVIGHGDGYARSANNFFIYRDPATERFVFFPWGIDVILGPDRAFAFEEEPPPSVSWATGAVAHALYADPEGRALLLSELQSLFDEHWDEEALLAEVDRWEALVAPPLSDVPEGEQALIAASTDEVRAFIAARRSALLAGVVSPPEGPAALPPSFCLSPSGWVIVSYGETGPQIALSVDGTAMQLPVELHLGDTDGQTQLTWSEGDVLWTLELDIHEAGAAALAPGRAGCGARPSTAAPPLRWPPSLEADR